MRTEDKSNILVDYKTMKPIPHVSDELHDAAKEANIKRLAEASKKHFEENPKFEEPEKVFENFKSKPIKDFFLKIKKLASFMLTRFY